MDCPAEQPEQGSSCYGLKGYQCFYPPQVTCRCPTDPGDVSWRCEGEQIAPPQHPRTVDGDRVVRDLSDEERQAWCEWYTRVEDGFPAPPDLEPTAEGYFPSSGCNVAHDFLGCSVSRPTDLSTAACVANLALSSCEATVRDLNDCVLSMQFFQPAPYGCARYLEAHGCDGTIVHEGPVGWLGGAGAGGAPVDPTMDHTCRVKVR